MLLELLLTGGDLCFQPSQFLVFGGVALSDRGHVLLEFCIALLQCIELLLQALALLLLFVQLLPGLLQRLL